MSDGRDQHLAQGAWRTRAERGDGVRADRVVHTRGGAQQAASKPRGTASERAVRPAPRPSRIPAR